MSYMAKCNGYVSVAPEKNAEDVISRLASEQLTAYIDHVNDYGETHIEIQTEDRIDYDENEIEKLLADVAADCTEGELEWMGEDDCHWRHLIRDMKVREETGITVYDETLDSNERCLAALGAVLKELDGVLGQEQKAYINIRREKLEEFFGKLNLTDFDKERCAAAYRDSHADECNYPMDRSVAQPLFDALLRILGLNYQARYDEAPATQPSEDETVAVENEKFLIRPFYWGDDEQLSDLPNFVYKPDGTQMHWYKYPARDLTVSRALTNAEFIAILTDCISFAANETGAEKA